MRLIDADAMFDENHCYTTFNKNLDYCDDNDLGEWIDEQPTVDAEPVRHGEWVETGFSTYVWWKYRCDKCGCQQDYKHNYCPDCGAKMDAKDTNVPTKKMAGGATRD